MEIVLDGDFGGSTTSLLLVFDVVDDDVVDIEDLDRRCGRPDAARRLATRSSSCSWSCCDRFDDGMIYVGTSSLLLFDVVSALTVSQDQG